MHVRDMGRQSSIRLSRSKRAGIHGGFEGLGGVFCCNGGSVDGFEPAVFFDLMRRYCGQRRFGPHDDDCLKLTVHFPGIAMDKKFANIKFRHV